MTIVIGRGASFIEELRAHRLSHPRAGSRGVMEASQPGCIRDPAGDTLGVSSC